MHSKSDQAPFPIPETEADTKIAPMTDHPILIADIGGTNARFALASTEQPFFVQAQTYQCSDYENIDQAIDAYLHAHHIEQLKDFALRWPDR